MTRPKTFLLLSKLLSQLRHNGGHHKALTPPSMGFKAEWEAEAPTISSTIIMETPSDGLSLYDLPFDVLLEIFLRLEVKDVLNLALVSRHFYEISLALPIWRNLAHKLMARSRRITLHDHLSPLALTASQLRTSVILATAAEHSWLQHAPQSIGAPRTVPLANVDLDHASYVMKFTSRRHLVLPTKGGRLVGWDMHTRKEVGSYDMGPDSVLINVQGEYSTRSLYWITGKMSADPDHTHNLKLTILRIQFPEVDSNSPITFEELAHMVTPWSFASELHFLDAPKRMFCAVFSNPETATTCLHVILDWSTGLSYVFDTGVPYEYGRAVIGLNLSSDGQQLVLHSEHWGSEIRRCYSLAPMREAARPWSPALSLPANLPKPQAALEDKLMWEHDRGEFADGDMAPHTVWVLPQWWPTYTSVPKRTSTIILYLATDADDEHKKTWRAAQHYSIASGEEGERMAGPCAPVRSVVDITNPVLINLGLSGLPILAQSFNHLGWIEEQEIDAGEDAAMYSSSSSNSSNSGSLDSSMRSLSFSLGKGRFKSMIRKISWRKAEKRKRRVLKLVTFPDPGCSWPSHTHECKKRQSGAVEEVNENVDLYNCDCTTLRPVTLDVPSAVLDNVYHMFLDPAAGTVTLATKDNELHVYQYGQPSTVPLV